MASRYIKYLFTSFLKGLVILGPFAITIYAIYKGFTILDNLIFNDLYPGVGFLFFIFIITFVGFLGTRFFIGRWLVALFDYVLEHTPGIKFIYTSVKEILDSFMGDKRKFNDPVWVLVQEHPQMWRIGFLTQKNMTSLGLEDKVAVYLPHSYAISGWVVIVDESAVKPVISMSAAEAMKFAVSGGITGSTSIADI